MVTATKGAAVPVGEIFLYGIWGVLALGALIVTALFLHAGD